MRQSWAKTDDPFCKITNAAKSFPINKVIIKKEVNASIQKYLTNLFYNDQPSREY